MQEHFVLAQHDQPHPSRTREILKAHPEIATLFGREWRTAPILLFVVALQTGIAAWLGLTGQPWWLALIIAYVVGAFANHCLYVIIHESTHNLIFQSRLANKIAGLVADMPNIFPGAMGFRNYHIKHHAHQGDYDYDADLASHWEAKLIGNTALGKAIWLLFFPLFQVTRPPRLKIEFWDTWLIINLLSTLAYDIAIIYFFGWTGFLYLAASLFFSIGLHPVGARWIQEHYTVKNDQETYSYYGPFNIVALNVGYHNEHHDFAAVPWSRLPEVRRMAPEYYDTLHYHTSWTKLLFKFLFDKNMSLHSRVERVGEGKVALDKARMAS